MIGKYGAGSVAMAWTPAGWMAGFNAAAGQKSNPWVRHLLQRGARGAARASSMKNALNAYLKSISLEPDQPDTLMAIANIYMDRNEHKTALEYYSSAYSLDNTLEYIDFLMAVAFYKLGDLASAKFHINKAFA